jgi:hypothetical protein
MNFATLVDEEFRVDAYTCATCLKSVNSFFCVFGGFIAGGFDAKNEH